jgi:hypothetical protein
VVFATSWTVPPCQAASGPEIDAEVQSTLAEFFAKVGFARALANRSVAILVFPTVLKAGFGIGGEYGEGALQIRGQTAGYYNIISGSIGFQLGAQARSGECLVVAKADPTPYQSVDELKGQVVAASVGTIYLHGLKAKSIFKEAKSFSTVDAALEALNKGG